MTTIESVTCPSCKAPPGQPCGAFRVLCGFPLTAGPFVPSVTHATRRAVAGDAERVATFKRDAERSARFELSPIIMPHASIPGPVAPPAVVVPPPAPRPAAVRKRKR